MQSSIKRFTGTATFILICSAIVLALAPVANSPLFESDFIKNLKEKFKAFYKQQKQDRLYVQTDKSFYKPGETVWFTAYVRDGETLKPSEKSDIIHVELITPKGTTEKHYKIIALNGSARGDFDLSGHPGGIYKLKAYTEWQKNDPNAFQFEKEITVQNVIMPRLKMKLEFEKKAYGKGDEVIAKLELNTNENKPLANRAVKLDAALDGKPLTESTFTTNDSGKVNLKFKLPADLSTVDGVVNAVLNFEGSTESISRSIPIVLNKIKLEFFPEGGDMVAAMNSRVAFRATNEFGKPADVEGIIVDSKGAFVTKFSSFHFGMGAINLAPNKNETYRARITKPEGILDEFNLPEVLDAGYVMNVAEHDKNTVELNINSWQTEELSLVAQTRGKIYYSGSLNAVKGLTRVAINTGNFPIGISQITLFDSKGIERSERLVFVNKNRQLTISVSTDKRQYAPREKVSMAVHVTDEHGLPMPGTFSLAVVDDNLLSFADDKQGNILSKILLEPDLKEKVEEPNFYFDAKEPKADEALDLLMMTSGWRRFTWKEINSDNMPAVMLNGEKATLSGVVHDGYTGQTVNGATLKLKNTSLSATTDKDGKFSFNKFDLSQSNQVEISAPNHRTQTQQVYNYGTASYYLYDNTRVRYEKFAEAAVPLAAGGAAKASPAEHNNLANKHEGEVGRGGMMEIAEQKLVPAGQIEDLADMAAPVALDLADNADLNEPVNPIMNAEIVVAQSGDLRAAGFAQFDEKAKQANALIYYRAKEFPVKHYTQQDSIRNDFTQTLFWKGDVETDRSGRAKIEFTTNDLISSFKTTVEGFGDDGSIGRGEYNFSTNLPFAMDAKIPTEMVSGDKAMIPVFLKNNTATDINGGLTYNFPNQLETTGKEQAVAIPAHESKVIYITCTAKERLDNGNLEVRFHSERFNDAIERKITVVAKGFPAQISLSGQELDKNFAINPVNVVPGSMKVSFKAYPNIMGELMSGVESILREPNGCFEQTSSSNYPNIMALQYLKTMQVKDPQLESKATNLLDKGYKRLVTFETKENGYEWFGAAPAHEALTAYGLMEFEDMKKVYGGVDEQMINRTVKLLLDKRDGNGGFKKNPRALDSFGKADDDITDAYIVYALSEAGYKDIEKELNAVYKSAKSSNDPYVLALCANAMFNLGDKVKGEELLTRLVSGRGEAAYWTGKKHSITRSTGDGLKVETTSLVLLALMKSQNPDIGAITNAVKFLVSARSGYGGFGSTQATILALKALTEYATFSKKTDEAGTVELLINGIVAATKDYAKGERNNIVIDGLEKNIYDGKQQIEVRFKNCKQALPYAMNISYSTILPESSKQCVVNLSAKLLSKTAKVGETVRLSATLQNKTNEGQPMTMAIIGIPAGFSVQPWQLKEMQDKSVIDFYEILGNNIAIYYRALAPNAQKQINFDLKAEIPGEYEAPAASAYLYYTSENKDWVGLDKVVVTAQ